ncbi:HAD family hydrolase [Noviherbaspirillum massiliense]|uniref:histidinol-phosphatase n=1 Tax=Noviherbaspirillum massiliense TaxID=1465823 RepID=UPI0002E1555C|nr:HAD family hydrolase [Noviherbaspirillum massiliense]
MNLALFDLDHTLLPLDSDYEWGQFLARIGAVDAAAYEKRNTEFFVQYQNGTLDPVEYLEFALGTLAQFPRKQLNAWHAQFMEEVIQPAILPQARNLVQQHQRNGDLVVIITATNRFVTAPIARAFDVENLIAAEPELTPEGELTGKLLGIPTSGPGKVTHLQAWLDARGKSLSSFDKSYFYSDSQNDIPLLSIVTNPVATNPNPRLKAHAHAHGWPTLNLFDD